MRRAEIDELLPAARKAVLDHGLGGLTIERVAAHAGLSRVTLHRRGVTREALVEALVEGAAQEMQAVLWPALASPGTARDRMERALDALCDVADQNLMLLSGMYALEVTVFHERRSRGRAGRQVRSDFVEPFTRLLRDGELDGTLVSTDPDETAQVLFNLVGWTYVHLRAAHGWSRKRARQRLLALVMAGLRPAAPPQVDGR